jgi:hypothetical protein
MAKAKSAVIPRTTQQTHCPTSVFSEHELRIRTDPNTMCANFVPVSRIRSFDIRFSFEDTAASFPVHIEYLIQARTEE